MSDCTPVSTPLPACPTSQPATMEDHAKVSSFPYPEAIGSLTYAALGTHLDITAAV